MQHLLYKRGYLITNRPVSNTSELVIKDWNKHPFANLMVWVHQDVHYLASKSAHTEIACIGIIIDPVNNLINSEAILEECIKQLQESWDLFWDYIDTLSGRFIIMLKYNDDLITFQDAVGARSVFYYKSDQNDDILLSSHSELIADLRNLQLDQEAVEFMNQEIFKNNKDRYFPGLFTPYKEILNLTPNTYLDLKTQKVSRFFPRKSRKSEKDTLSLHDISGLLRNQLHLLNSHYKLAISLTGGIDSRLTLAASKEIKESIYYYTIIYGKNHNPSINDARIAKTLSDTFELDFHVLEYENEPDPYFSELFLKNTSQVSTEYRMRIAETLYHTYPDHLLHIKSNIVDIAKAHLRNRYAFLPDESQPKVFTKMYDGNNHSPYTDRVMNHFIETTQLKKELIFDYDLYDLYTWEQKNGNWQSLSLHEWDIVQDTFIIYNNRTILKHFIFQPFRDKKRNAMHYSLIEKMWPELLTVEVHSGVKVRWKTLLRVLKGLSLRFKLFKQ